MRIEVAGIPAPQGSKRHVGGGRMVESSRAVGPWREAVRAETQRAVKQVGPVAGPVAITAHFYLARPKSTPKRVLFPVKRPDLDKLLRSTLDGLVDGGAFDDDSQVTYISAVKNFAVESRQPGCTIWVEEDE